VKKINYTTVEELLVSDGFLKWYRQTDEKQVQIWNEWIAGNPEHQRLANDAVEVLLFIKPAAKNKITEQEIRAAVDRLTDTIRNIKSNDSEARKKFTN
jgi:thymidylate synthase